MKKYHYIGLMIGLLAGLPLQSGAAEKRVDVYLLGGQSNMQGIAKIKDLPATQFSTTALPHTYFWNGTQFEPYILGTTKTSSRAGEFGPELGFALSMATEENPIYLIKYHASGQPLHHGWNGNKWVGGNPAPDRWNFYPGEQFDDINKGKLYSAMLNRYVAGIKNLKDSGNAPVVRGFLWMQGEQDSKNKASATVYAASLKRLHRRIGEDLGLKESLPMAFGQVLPHEPPLDRFTHRDEIRDQMAAVDAESGRREAVAQIKMVSTDGFGLLPDTVHYDAAGQLRLGLAFTAAIKQLQTVK